MNHCNRTRYLIVLSLAAASVSPAVAQERWRDLVVTAEYRCSVYDRDDYRYPPTVEQNIVTAMGGRIYSPYTATHFASTHDTDIEHIVALSEAHDSGACAWDGIRRRAFARDLDNLTLASPAVNRNIKRAKDAAEWLPANNRCWYANRVAEVKHKYALTVDPAEAAALKTVLSACPDVAMVVTDTPARVATPTRAGACGPFKNCTALRHTHPNGVPRGHCAYRASMDRDRDGWACER